MEYDLQLYSQLLILPLFQGLGKADLESVVAHTKLGFHKYEAGEITETIMAPELLQLERLFGLTQHFSKTFKAVTTCSILSVEKSEVIRLSDEFLIFRINLFNILSTCTQKYERMLLRQHAKSLESRIIRFFADRCIRPAGRKIIKIKMTQLALELNDSRRNVSKALNYLETEGIVSLKRNFVEIKHIEDALQNIEL